MATFIVALIDLLLQISVFALLLSGLVARRKRRIGLHAKLLLSAAVLNLISFLAVMGPAWDSIGEGTTGVLSSVGLVHVAFGGLTMLASLWVLGVWVIPKLFVQNSKLRCYGKLNKRIMDAVTVLWLCALVVGFILFLMANTTILGTYPIVAGN